MPVECPVHPWIDCSEAPLFVWHIANGDNEEELRACLAIREQWAEKNTERFAWVIDLQALRGGSARQRQLLAAHLEKLREYNRKYNVGCALVVPNPIVRGLVTAVFWISPPTFPTRFFATWEEGKAWARQQLRNAKRAQPVERAI